MEAKIDLMIVGAQKAGTTSLNNYLKGHPEVSTHDVIEFSFFTNKEEYSAGFSKAFNKFFPLGSKKVNIAKNVTVSLDEASLPKLKEHNPEMKLVFILREPVARAYSAYTMAIKDGWLDREFSELKNVMDKKDFEDVMFRHFVKHGHYDDQLSMMLEYFPSAQIKVYLFEDLKNNPQAICDEVYKWVGLEPVKIEEEVHNPTFKPKSKKMGKAINWLRKESNPIKRMVRGVLPYSFFTKIGESVVGLNKTNQKFEKIAPEMKLFLDDYFEQKNKSLKSTLESMDEGSFVALSGDNWIGKV